MKECVAAGINHTPVYIYIFIDMCIYVYSICILVLNQVAYQARGVGSLSKRTALGQDWRDEPWEYKNEQYEVVQYMRFTYYMYMFYMFYIYI